jgi:RNA polymerase sigma-70 factor (ECF subfamily)
VKSLPLLYSSILLLREWEQMSYEDIASVLEIPIGTVRSRLHNATVLLMKKLDSSNSPLDKENL